MKKEDFVAGKWYTSSEFADTQAIKFKELREGGKIIATARIYKHTYLEDVNTFLYTQSLSTFSEVSLNKIRPYLPGNHPEKYPTLEKFPENGFCTYDAQVEDYLVKILKLKKGIYSILPKHHSMIGWNVARGLWAVQDAPFSTYSQYYKEQVKHFINTNTIKNGSNNEVQGTKTEVRRTDPDGTARLASRRCQSAVGSRPKGNKAPVDTGRTLVKCSEIKPNIVHTRYI